MNNLSAPIEITHLDEIEFGSGTNAAITQFARTAHVPSQFNV